MEVKKVFVSDACASCVRVLHTNAFTFIFMLPRLHLIEVVVNMSQFYSSTLVCLKISEDFVEENTCNYTVDFLFALEPMGIEQMQNLDVLHVDFHRCSYLPLSLSAKMGVFHFVVRGVI